MIIKQVTPAQLQFARILADHGSMTTKEISAIHGTDVKYAYSVMRSLISAGIVEKTFEGVDPSKDKRLAWRYKLIVPLESIKIKPRSNPSGRIPDEEILYAAILRNAGLTGHALQDQFRILYPHRSRKTIMSNILPKARRKKLCR